MIRVTAYLQQYQGQVVSPALSAFSQSGADKLALSVVLKPLILAVNRKHFTFSKS